MKYELKDLKDTGFMEGEDYKFQNKKEILNFLLDDFLNFRMDEHNIEDLNLNYMLKVLSLKIIEIKQIQEKSNKEILDEILNKLYYLEDSRTEYKNKIIGDCINKIQELNI